MAGGSLMASYPDDLLNEKQRAGTPALPPPLDWLYQPGGGGFDSVARAYRGYEQRQLARVLRPAVPVRLELKAADLLTFTAIDGATPVLLIPLDDRGHHDFQALGLASNPVTTVGSVEPGLESVASWYRSQGGNSAGRSISGNGSNGRNNTDVNNTDVKNSGVNSYDGKSGIEFTAVRVFDASTPAGDTFIVRATAAVTLWLMIDPKLIYSAERLQGGGMGGAISYQHVPDDVTTSVLPEPFGDMRDEFTIPRGSARSYTLNAGEVVQIIDVEGQQCSDFMAMNARSLDAGLERYIDSTATRSMVRSAYPMPGLFDKFFDQDLRPLLKLKQDTVGRHDTFALACTARGYEERGFFGHLNCSDNISHAYQPYGIEARPAWPAINFFFNSWIDHADNRIQSDEAWSRPGDYVAMEAMTDLVAVSTACPDDVDPINGWNPTDIHVRIYKKNTPVRHAVAYRSKPDSEAILTEHSAFHERTSALTRHYAVARDLWLPQSFEATRAIEEYHACRQAVTVQDMSSLRKFDVLGPDAQTLLQQAITRNVTKLSVNRGVYALMCDDTGAVIDDGTLFRLSEDTFRWCCGSDDSGLQLKQLAEKSGLNVWVKSLYSAMPNLAVQGPGSRELLQRISFTQPTVTSVEQLRWFGSTIARLHDREGEPFHLTRTGYTGELGYEIFCHSQSAVAVWDALMTAGEDLGVTPMGLEALEMIRIEAGLMAAGAEFGPDIDEV
ncbi:hypothetical protein AB833_30955 [Chromatiales bacterium (ex Bugula neritina AB1)]|nr:hypothetical protein AB833_30955 [Chromatiales bacterium (ex Bugula neritina AB1)]